VHTNWIDLTIPLSVPPASEPHAWSLLRCNGHLAGSNRVAVLPGRVIAHLRADLHVGGAIGGSSVINTLSDGLRQAERSWRTLGSTSDVPCASTEPVHQTEAERFVGHCAEAGWRTVTRPSGEIVCPIDARGTTYTARFASVTSDSPHVLVDLVEAQALTPASREATALLLLTASAVVRSIKGLAAVRDGVEWLSIATALDSLESPDAIDRALSALSVACTLVAPEALALGDEPLARSFLAARGWRPASIVPATDPSHSETEEVPCMQPQ
jgi:hypothetical protein